MPKEETEDAGNSNDKGDKAKSGAGEDRRSYLERLKEKIGKLKEEDPNIYPLW
jgi:hypothetical protein